jgi:hypothetical protein
VESNAMTTRSYGVDFTDTYGTASFKFTDVLPDIAEAALEMSMTGTMWLNSVKGKVILSTEKTDASYAKVVFLRSEVLEPTLEEIAWMNENSMYLLKVVFPSGRYELLVPIAYKEAMPFTNRQWAPGEADCYRLVLDYYRRELKINLPALITPINYVEQARSYQGQNLFLTGWQESGMVQVLLPQENDVILMRTGSVGVAGPDHCAVYLKDNKILHHYINRLSTVQEYLGLWKQSTVMVLRHKTRV